MTLLGVPNVSAGRDYGLIERLRDSLGAGVDLLDESSDIDHNRTVFTVAGDPEPLIDVLSALARIASAEIDMSSWEGVHPAIGALDVCPVVWLAPGDRDLACETALEVAGRIGDLDIPVFLYGDLATDPARAERAYFREGGFAHLAERMSEGTLEPDFGPLRIHPLAGATLVTARPPLAAFNIELEVPERGIAVAVAAEIRESAGGPPGLRAIGTELSTGREQVSMNIHDPEGLRLAEVVDLVSGVAAGKGAQAVEAELIGLVPSAALVGYGERIPIRDFDPGFHVIEARIGQVG